MDAAGDQIQGARPRQEDSYALETTADGGRLAVIADGLGGHPAGDVASREGVTEFVRAFSQLSSASQQPPHSWMEEAILAADRHLRQRQVEDRLLRGMGTTLVALYLRAQEAYALSVGDSYLFLLRGGSFYRMNDLHTEDGLITSCLGSNFKLLERSEPMRVRSGDRFLLATDGILTLAQEDVVRSLGKAPSAADAVRALLAAIEQAMEPTQDNATAVAVFVP